MTLHYLRGLPQELGPSVQQPSLDFLDRLILDLLAILQFPFLEPLLQVAMKPPLRDQSLEYSLKRMQSRVSLLTVRLKLLLSGSGCGSEGERDGAEQ